MATIEPADLIRLIQQYLKENNLLKTLQCLQDETSVSLNAVDSIESFVNDINSGHWDVVLRAVKILKLPDHKLMDLYEQIAIELIEIRETRAANWLIHKTEPIVKLKATKPERYLHLQTLLAKNFFDPKEAYRDGSSKKERRGIIANELKKEVTVVPPQRLLNLVSDALKWRKHEGLLPASTTIDIFTGKALMEHPDEETFPNVLHKHPVKPVKNLSGDDDGIFVSCAEFSPDGQYIVVGYSTGMIEIRNATTGRIAKDLKYQALDNFIVTPSKRAALSLSFSGNDLLAVGDKSGDISIWRLEVGEFVQLFQKAHTKSVSCLLFHRNGKEILSGGHGGSIKLHGRQSNKTIRDYVGHRNFVYGLAYSKDDNNIVSGGSDCTVRIWNAKTAQLLHEYKSSAGIHTILLMPNFKSDIFLVGNRTRSMQLIDLGAVPRKELTDELVTDDTNGESKDDKEHPPINFFSACVSPKGNWIYAVDSAQICCFSYATKKVQNRLLAVDDTLGNDLIGVRHHPFHNLLATYDTQVGHRTLKTLKSRHDELNDQPLLKRLKKLSVIGGKKNVPTPPAVEVIKDDIAQLPERKLPLDKLRKMLILYQSDPLTWNPSVLGRIFKIPENYCANLAIHIGPMAYWHNATTHREFQKLIKTVYVVDVGRLKSDDNYLNTYKRIIFPEYKDTSLPKKALPDYLDQIESERVKRLGRVKAVEMNTLIEEQQQLKEGEELKDRLALSSQSHHRPLREEIS